MNHISFPGVASIGTRYLSFPLIIEKAKRAFWSRSASYNQLIYQSFLMLLGFL